MVFPNEWFFVGLKLHLCPWVILLVKEWNLMDTESSFSPMISPQRPADFSPYSPLRLSQSLRFMTPVVSVSSCFLNGVKLLACF